MVGRSASDEAHLDLLEPDRLRRTELGVAIVARGPDRADRIGDRRVGRIAADEWTEIVPLRREQARVQRAVCRQARTGALGAERLRHRRDHPDLAAAIAVAPALGDLARVVLLDRLERQLAVDRRDDLA